MAVSIFGRAKSPADILDRYLFSFFIHQNTFAYVKVVYQSKKFQGLIFFGKDYMFTYENDRDMKEVLDKQANRFIQRAIAIVLLIIFSMLATVLYPMFALFVLKKRVLFFNIILPFNDPESDHGFYMNFANLSLIGILGIPGNLGIELMNIIIVNNLQSGAVIIKFKMDRFNKLILEQGEYTKEMQGLLRDILMGMQDLNK